MLWAKLYALHEGGAHLALGYSDWGAYCEGEFGWSPAQGQHVLNAGRVRAELEQKVTTVTLPGNAAVARELSPVLHKAPELLEDVWHESVATAEGGEPTAAEVRAVVDLRAPQVRPRPRPRQKAKRPRLSKYERRLQLVQQYTDQLVEIEKLAKNACTRLRNGELVEASVQNERGRWRDLLRRTDEHLEMARAMLDRQAREEGN
jgi:hypothetical protein